MDIEARCDKTLDNLGPEMKEEINEIVSKFLSNIVINNYNFEDECRIKIKGIVFSLTIDGDLNIESIIRVEQ